MTSVSAPSAASHGSATADGLAIAASVSTLALLAALHVLSPEFDPSWRAVSEYATGQHGAVLSAMFLSWAVSSWALAFSLWPQVQARWGRIGLAFLVAAGVGEAMASIFDITHPLHGVSAMIGIPSLAIAAMLVSINLGRTPEWRSARAALRWTSNLTWISLLILAASFGVFISTYRAAGGNVTDGVAPTTLPEGVIAVIGWANRFLIVAYCAWVFTTAWHSRRQLRQPS